MGTAPCGQLAAVAFQGLVNVCGLDAEPRDVGEAHSGDANDRLEVVERERELAPHIAGVLRVAGSIDGGLASTDQLPGGPRVFRLGCSPNSTTTTMD